MIVSYVGNIVFVARGGVIKAEEDAIWVVVVGYQINSSRNTIIINNIFL